MFNIHIPFEIRMPQGNLKINHFKGASKELQGRYLLRELKAESALHH